MLIEAVSAALSLAPGINRSFLFEGWADFDPNIWHEGKVKAKQMQFTEKTLPLIIGCEQDTEIARQAK